MKIHLKGIDTLRSLAALIVVWGHLEYMKKANGLPNLLSDGYYIPSGHTAVMLFFVISGFLITYLLIKEKRQNNTISLKKFYIRRTLRILPLYYITLFLSYILFIPDYSQTTFLLNVGILPNIAHAVNSAWSTSPHIWSIGVEEQFYLLCPLFLCAVPEKKIPRYLILFFTIYTFLPDIINDITSRYLHRDELNYYINGFFYLNKFNCLSIGVLAGYLFATDNKSIKLLNNNYVAFISALLIIVLWLANIKPMKYNDEICSILFAIFICNVVANPSIKIDTKISSFLGDISYGIYMYHWIIILMAVKYLPLMENLVTYNLVLYTSVFGGTVLISNLSYLTIEKYFLEIKKKFEIDYQNRNIKLSMSEIDIKYYQLKESTIIPNMKKKSKKNRLEQKKHHHVNTSPIAPL